MPTPIARATAQAELLQAVCAAAKKKMVALKPPFPIDPQGRVLLEVQLLDEEKAKFEKDLGHPLQKTTLVSWDLQTTRNAPPLQALLGLDEKIIQAYQGLAKGQIIALQQETYFHAHLIGQMLKAAVKQGEERVTQKKREKIFGDTDLQFQEALEHALKILNNHMLDLQKKALEKAFEKSNQKGTFDETLFSAILNEELDKARKIMLPDIAKTVRTELIKATGINFTENITRHLSKSLAMATTSSSHDVIHVDKGMGLVSFIGASIQTAHHRALGTGHLADRVMYSHRIDENQLVTPLSNRLHIRIPSIALKRADEDHSPLTEDAIINDTKDKITHLQEKYHLGKEPRAEGRPREAFIYNLYTTLNKKNLSGFIDEVNNEQRQSAEYILKAAHQHNREKTESPWCLVQNIPVNGWGYELSIRPKNRWVNEATLMTQMATIHTIFDALTEADKILANELFEDYKRFLASPGTFFYDYAIKNPGVFNHLNTLKKNTNFPRVAETPDSFTVYAKQALASLFKEDAYTHHKYGYTYQALSVFVEQSSMGGCKSANERAQHVNGRVSIFDFLSLGKERRHNLLTNYLSTTEASRLINVSDDLEEQLKLKNTDGITKNLDALFESLNLEGFQTIVSLLDQGGHAKLGTKGLIPNTNYSETVKTHVKYTSQWQSHKGLTNHVLHAFCGTEKIDFKEEWGNVKKRIGLGAIGGMLAGVGTYVIAAAIIGASFAFPPLGIAIGMGMAMATIVTSIGILVGFVSQLWSSRAGATKGRFDKIQEENRTLIREAQTSIEIERKKMALSQVSGNEPAKKEGVIKKVHESKTLSEQDETVKGIIPTSVVDWPEL